MKNIWASTSGHLKRLLWFLLLIFCTLKEALIRNTIEYTFKKYHSLGAWVTSNCFINLWRMLPRESDKKYLYTLLSNGKYLFLNCRVLNIYRTAMTRLTSSENWLITFYGPHSMNLNVIKVHLDFVAVCLRCSNVQIKFPRIPNKTYKTNIWFKICTLHLS